MFKVVLRGKFRIGLCFGLLFILNRSGYSVRMDNFSNLGFILLKQEVFADESIDFVIETNKIFGLVVLVHTNIFKFEIDKYAVFGEVVGELKELEPEGFNELRVDVGDPGLDFDGDVLEQEVETGVLLEQLLQPDDVRVDESFEFFGLEEHVFFLKRVKLYSAPDHDFAPFQHLIFAPSERVVFIFHNHNDQTRHLLARLFGYFRNLMLYPSTMPLIILLGFYYYSQLRFPKIILSYSNSITNSIKQNLDSNLLTNNLQIGFTNQHSPFF